MEQTPSKQQALKAGYRWLVFILAGLLFLGWLTNTPPGVLGKADAVGYSVCHRIDARSFHIGERQMPLCARCSGMFLGALVGLVYQAVLFPRRTGVPRWYILVILAVFAAAFAFDGLNSYLHLIRENTGLYEPQNWLRLVTGTGMGIAMAAGLYPAFNSTVWSTVDSKPALHGPGAFGGLLLAAAGVDALVLLDIPAVLYPLALLSAAGVVVLLVMIYTILLVTVFRQDNRYSSLRALALPLAAGFFAAISQIALIDALRFLLTQTWGGFTFG